MINLGLLRVCGSVVTLVKMGRWPFGLPVFVSVQCWARVTATFKVYVLGVELWRAECTRVEQELGAPHLAPPLSPFEGAQ